MNKIILWFAVITRRIQALSPDRPIRGLGRFAHWIASRMARFAGVIRLSDGLRLYLDTASSYEGQLLFTGIHQPAVMSWLRKHTTPGCHCLDVGANIGYYTIKLANWAGVQGRVAAFEANPALAARIRQQVELNVFTWVDVVARAVHNRSEILTFYVAGHPSKSSVVQGRVGDPVEALQVEAITIDEYIESAGWQRLDVIKIDIEGNECNALLGAQQSIKRFRPHIIFEYWHNTPPETAAHVFTFFQQQDYSLWEQSDGQMIPFDWHEARMDVRHTDIIAHPENRSK